MAQTSGKIRVGVVNCDLHAVWYGAFIEEPDPRLVMEHYKIVHYYFYYMYDAEQLAIPRVRGFDIVKCWDRQRTQAEKFSQIFRNKPKVCDTLAEASEGVDLVFVADCQGDGSEHLTWARPGLKKGVPTFVDKPFSNTVKDAKAMVRLAKRSGAPLLSLSLLREAPAAVHFRHRFQEIQPVCVGVVRGSGGWDGGHFGGIIHTLSLAQCCFGTGVESVQCMGIAPLEFIHLHYPGDVSGIEVICMNPRTIGPNCAAFAAAYTRAAYRGTPFYHKKGYVHSDAIDDWAFIGAGEVILKKIRKMVRTHKPVEPYENMLELIKIAEAARIAQRTGRRVHLKQMR